MQGSIEIKGLEVCFGDQKVLKGVDLTVPPGKVTAIIGPSGCGKTTLLRCLNRMSELTEHCEVRGQLLLDGENILQMDPILLRRRVGMVFQRPNPFAMSIRENVLYGVKATKMKVDHDTVVRATLTKAALWEELKGRLHDNAMKLSVGQQQRLCIARSLAISPEVLLMDEPASALDPLSTSSLESSILAMKGDCTQIIVTHNLYQALKVSDYLVFVDKGVIVEHGETKSMYHNPTCEQTREYIMGRDG